MSEVKDPAIKLFGRTISLPLIPNHSSPLTRPPSSSSPCQVSSETEEPSRKELTSVVQDDGASQQTTEDVKSPTTSSGISENAKTPSAETETSLLKSSTNGEQSETTSVSEEKTPKKPDKILPCPRCHSMDTKFCYYNNYNVNQPRHFCKNCQRYWTAGGTMRNVPIGAGRRKNKNSSSSHYRHMMVPEALQGAKLNAPNAVMGNGAAVLTFGSEPPLCDSMASVLNIAERTQNCVPNGFNATEPNNFVSYGKEDDHSSGVSVTTSTSSERQGPTGSHDKRIEGFPPQLQYFPSSSWPYAWNSAQWNSSMPPPAPAFCPPGYPLSFYTTPAYWGCVPGPPPSWNMSCTSPQSSAHGSVPNAPTLGKHSRDGNIITPTNSQKEKAETEHNSAENNILIPKTLRIDDDSSEAAKSSMWSKVGMKNDKGNSVNGGGLFQAFPSKGNDKNHMVEASPMLHANPAALSRSLTFHEQT